MDLPSVELSNGLRVRSYNLNDVGYKSSNSQSQIDPITVYLVPHTHLDPGWIKTIDEYYEQKVKYILINVIDQLSD